MPDRSSESRYGATFLLLLVYYTNVIFSRKQSGAMVPAYFNPFTAAGLFSHNTVMRKKVKCDKNYTTWRAVSYEYQNDRV